MLLSIFTDNKLREKFQEQGVSKGHLLFFLRSCLIWAFAFIVLSFSLFESSKEFSSPYFIAAMGYMLLPFTLKWFQRASTSFASFPVIFLIALTQFSFLNTDLHATHLTWIYLIPYFCIHICGQHYGIIYSVAAFFIIVVSKILSTAIMLDSDLFEQVVHFSLPYSFITYLCWHFHVQNKKAKNLYRRNKEIAFESQKNKDTFWGNISHEIRTPLNGILGMTHLLSESELKDEQQDLLNIIRSSAENLNIVLSDIIDYSKLEMNKIEINKQVTHLASCLDQIILLFGHHARKKKVHLSYIIDADVPSGIYVDSDRLKQILINLVSNALKFTESGSVKIVVERFDRKETLRFSVEDTGIGIAEDQKDKLFSPFTQIDADTTRKYGGVGIGLVICAKLVNLLGGTIEVESQVGHGSIFSFTLTAIPARALPDSNQDMSASIHHLTKNIPLNILVVEDNLVNQRLLTTLLKKNGYTSDVANDGLEAVEAFQKNYYHLVFMDIQMPRMDGITATQKILEMHPDTPPKIIAVTANALQEDRDRCFQAGMDDFLTKPINNYLLLSLLKRYSEQAVDIDDIDHKADTKNLAHHDTSFSAMEYHSFDADQLLHYYDQDMDVILTLHEEFKQRYSKELSLLETATHQKNFLELASVAHSFKGSLMSLQSEHGKYLASRIEEFSHQGDLAPILDLVAQLTTHCEKLAEELDHFTSKQTAA